jgi:hypothetical protein
MEPPFPAYNNGGSIKVPATMQTGSKHLKLLPEVMLPLAPACLYAACYFLTVIFPPSLSIYQQPLEDAEMWGGNLSFVWMRIEGGGVGY